MNVYRNHCFLIQKRMTAFLNIDAPFFVEIRFGTVVTLGQHGPGKNEIKFR